jgi:hypothetical protein
MSMIEDMTKEKQALSDEHQKQMDQTASSMVTK